jgi:hypothetical protein
MDQWIESGKLCWVDVDGVRFQVLTIRPAALEGWWLCEGLDTGDPIVLPVHVLSAGDAEQS